MSGHVYKTIELTGTSMTGIDDAVKNAISKASKSVHNMRWFQITETRGNIENNQVGQWQVTLKLGFTLDG